MSGFDEIVEIAKTQKGYVATYQVPEVSSQLIAHHESAGNLERVARGIYRVEMMPTEEDEEFVIAYLWSRELGVISHESALSIHRMSDVLPRKTHVTLPPDEKPIRRQTPDWIVVHFGDVRSEDRQWSDVVPVTTPERTLIDVAADAIDPDLFDQALDQAKARGLVRSDFERRLIRELIMRRK